MFPNTPEDIVASLRMFRLRYPRHSLVVIEGPTDNALWTEYICDRCRLVPAGNKEKALKALDIVNTRTSLEGVAAIVDPDYWLYEQSSLLALDNLLYDDSPDMELMLLRSRSLEKVMRHTFVEFETDEIHLFANELRIEAIRLAGEFGYFRLLDYRHREYNLMLRRVADKFADFIDLQTIQFKRGDVAETLLQESGALTVSELLSRARILEAEATIEVTLCRGRDAVSLLSLILPLHFKRVFHREMSQRARHQTTGNELTRALRMSFEFAHFVGTVLYSRIRDWESANTPYKILKPDI